MFSMINRLFAKTNHFEDREAQTNIKDHGKIKGLSWWLLLVTGVFLPLSFAPFHMPGAAILGMALFYTQIQKTKSNQAFWAGWLFGIGFFGFGVSWVSVSIHKYGHLNLGIAYAITIIFIAYLALFPGLAALAFHWLSTRIRSSVLKSLLFSSIWCVTEYLRATCLTGFPWLLLGIGQMDTPLKYCLPLIGIYGVSFLVVMAACCLAQAVRRTQLHLPWLIGFVGILILPASLKNIHWTHLNSQPISVGVIQANLSMRDKWDDKLFWNILEYYQTQIDALIGKKQLIILPESAIPLPAMYVHDFLEEIHTRAKRAGSAILFGIPEEANTQTYYNTLTTIGHASGTYRKQHLVPFGEYIPQLFMPILQWMHLDLSNMQSGKKQPLITALNHPFASLICYELAYPELLRQQMPNAEWIVSLSDDGWFGHSLAIYQHLQMAQVLSALTGRYQIVANNDGLSSVISTEGTFAHSLPAFSFGTLEDFIYAAQGKTPWVRWGDTPFWSICLCIILLAFAHKYAFITRARHNVLGGCGNK